MPLLPINDRAPEFSVPDQSGAVHTLSQYKGKWVLLYFYPKDDTSGCTTEACELRDHFADLHEKGCVVLGVSADSVESHDQFAAKHQLPFPLLADENRSIIEAYGASKIKLTPMSSGIARISYLIDPEGVIKKVYEGIVPETHAEEVIRDLQTL
jgi:peroxiredoxin Q/BCP